MRATAVDFSPALPRLIRLVALSAALSMAGALVSQAAGPATISVAEPICVASAFADGPTQVAATSPAGAASTVDPGHPGVLLPEDGESSFGGTSAEGPRILLPKWRHDRLERPRWSRSEKGLLWSFASLNAVDAYQTMNAPGNVREANPLLASWAGDHPSPFETLAFKSIATYGMYKLAGRIEKRSTRRLALILANFVQFSVVAHNEEVTGGLLF